MTSTSRYKNRCNSCVYWMPAAYCSCNCLSGNDPTTPTHSRRMMNGYLPDGYCNCACWAPGLSAIAANVDDHTP